ncbi:MAG TPA: hypothetical protein PLU24_04615, partial [Candidatus Omnitrophota bacterium]|nr:hypothetical protein [Candidatus Omnitrophota bacterium]
MRRILLVLILFFGLSFEPALSEESPQRYLFVSLIQKPHVFASRQDMLSLVQFAKKARIKALFIQIYRANIAIFPSKIG